MKSSIDSCSRTDYPTRAGFTAGHDLCRFGPGFMQVSSWVFEPIQRSEFRIDLTPRAVQLPADAAPEIAARSH
jgi:hypothetical protein